jgi:hypothetical protein
MNLARACMFAFPCFLVNITACVATDAEDGLSEEELTIDENSDAIGFSSGVSHLPARGGGGGNPVRLACASNQVMTGVYGRTGTKVDRLGIYCAYMNDAGALGSSVKMGSYGGWGGSDKTAICPSGQLMVGLRGYSGSEVDQLRISCVSAALWLSGGGASQVTLGGGSGGSWFNDYCPRSYVMQALDMRTGSRVDRVQGECHQITGP